MESGPVRLGELLRVVDDADGRWRLEGEVDASNADALLDLLRSARPDLGDVELDLTALSYMDSSGIRVIVLLLRDLDEPRRLILRVRAGPVARVLRISDLASLLNLRIEMVGAAGEEPPPEDASPEGAVEPPSPPAPSST